MGGSAYVRAEGPEVANGSDNALRLLVSTGGEDTRVADELHARAQFVEAHGGGLDAAREALADAPEVLAGERTEFHG